MKKVWLLIFVALVFTSSVRAEYIDRMPADKWVDSVYQKLTIAEQVGQLIDLRISPRPDNIDEIERLISEYHVGAITLAGGDAKSALQLIRSIKGTEKSPIYISCENNQSLSLPFQQPMKVPSPETFNVAGEVELLENTLEALANIYLGFGIKSHSFNPISTSFSENGFEVNNPENDLNARAAQYYFAHGMATKTNLDFSFVDEFAFSPKKMDAWNNTEWKQKVEDQMGAWNQLNNPLSILNIIGLPDFPENEAVYFDKKVVSPLFWKHLQFSGILSVDYNHIISNPLQEDDATTVRKLFMIGADKIITSTEVDMVHSALMRAIENREIRKNDIREKVKRNLRFKYQSGLYKNDQQLLNEDHVDLSLNSPRLLQSSYEVYRKASQLVGNEKSQLPILDISNSSFASLSLGYTEDKTFQETLDKYAPFVHYMLPDAAFNPYDLEVISEQLKLFDQVIIGLHTNGLVSFDQTLLQFLNELNESTNVVLVFFGKEINSNELRNVADKVFMYEDNAFTQQIAAYEIFGADKPEVGRLSYSLPEMQGMDSRTLSKIEKIVKEAISVGATPGCQVLVARNGSVIFEKGFGYYTYDSIMEVDTRTIYDLASVTKVAATTQAVMKLSDTQQINLDTTLGAYLPELVGTNKENLVIEDVLAHQSGLKAFYPFWRYTINDNEQTLHYYKRYPDENYSNTVAYGMFAAEDLKDSLWSWTIDTKLRRKRNDYQPYDYKYSDLGFYLVQMLVERAANTTLDHYLDSVFYQPMGMGTMTFNPLCKFQLKRITPTERDTNFRNVLVWGTVHDQIAAMKGGVSGHAGLFSNAHDVAKIMQLQLQGGSYGGKQYFSTEIVNEFTRYHSDKSRRGLGWDKPEKGDEFNPYSRYASFDSYGHRGFTGTITWADPTFNLIFVFLSNRIYPDMGNNKLSNYNIRKRIQDVVYESIWDFEKEFN